MTTINELEFGGSVDKNGRPYKPVRDDLLDRPQNIDLDRFGRRLVHSMRILDAEEDAKRLLRRIFPSNPGPFSRV